jgi:signal transduction histidine kinase
MTGLILGSLVPILFIYLDIKELGEEFTWKNIVWIANSQLAITVSVFGFPLVFMIISLLFFDVLLKRNQIRDAQAQIAKMAHAAGMSEIASEVLHNIGNTLTVINLNLERLFKRTLPLIPVGKIKKADQFLLDKPEILEQVKSASMDGHKLLLLHQAIGKRVLSCVAQLDEGIETLLSKTEVIKEILIGQQKYAKAESFSQETKVSSLLKTSKEFVDHLLAQHHVSYFEDLSEDPQLKVEVNKLVNVFVNLLKNACEAMDNSEQRIIKVKGYREAQSFLIEVTDTGRGIAKADLDSMFQHGFTTKEEGHGFGLHSCANIVNAMGGSLSCRSDGEGKGATFIVSLPME